MRKILVSVVIIILNLCCGIIKINTTDYTLITAYTTISTFRQQKPSRGEEYRIIETMAIITAYDAGYESTGKNPGDIGYSITASGKKAMPYHTVALPPEFPFGTLVVIDDPQFKNIIFVNEDRGGGIKTINNNLIKVDVYMNTREEALKYGKQIRKIYLKIKN